MSESSDAPSDGQDIFPLTADGVYGLAVRLNPAARAATRIGGLLGEHPIGVRISAAAKELREAKAELDALAFTLHSKR